MKSLKRILLLSALLLITAFPLSAQAASTKSKALKAYSQMLSQSKLTGANLTSADCSFALAYIDDDSVPELVIRTYQLGSSNGYFELYTYRKGKIVYLGHLWGTTFSYYKKKGVYLSAGSINAPHGGPGRFYTYSKLSKGKIVSTLSKTIMEPSTIYNRSDTEYYYSYSGKDASKTKSISKSAFSKKLKSLVGSKKITNYNKMKFYDNTAANRSAHLK